MSVPSYVFLLHNWRFCCSLANFGALRHCLVVVTTFADLDNTISSDLRPCFFVAENFDIEALRCASCGGRCISVQLSRYLAHIRWALNRADWWRGSHSILSSL